MHAKHQTKENEKSYRPKDHWESRYEMDEERRAQDVNLKYSDSGDDDWDRLGMRLKEKGMSHLRPVVGVDWRHFLLQT